MSQSNNHSLDNVHIGQTIFIVMNDSLKIIPAVVAEKSSIETLTESSIVWKVMVGPAEKRKIYPLDKIPGDKFATLEEAKAEILNSFHDSLEEEVQDTIEKTMLWYKIPKSQISTNKVVTKSSASEAKNDDSDMFDPSEIEGSYHTQKEISSPVKRPRGRPPKAAKTSQTTNNNHHFQAEALTPSLSKKEAKKYMPKPSTAQEALRAALEGDDDDDDDSFVDYGDGTSVDGEANVIMPDGERIRVKL